MSAYVKVNGTYREVPNAQLYTKQGGQYVATPAGWVKDNSGVYRQFHTGSDPVTYYFQASLTRAARGTTWKSSSSNGGSNYPEISRYLTSSGVYPWYGLVEFYQDTSGVSLASRLAGRPVVKKAYFNVGRWHDGGFGSGWGDLHIGKYDASSSVTPSNTYCNFSSVASKNYNAQPAGRTGTTIYYNDGYLTRSEFVGGDPGSFPNGFPGRNENVNGGFELGNARQVLVDHLAGVGTTNGRRPLCMSHTTSNSGSNRGLGSLNTASYAEQGNFWNFWPAGTTYLSIPIGPTLVVELDYV